MLDIFRSLSFVDITIFGLLRLNRSEQSLLSGILFQVLHRAYVRPAVKLLLTQSVESVQKHFLEFLKNFHFVSKSSSPVPENCGLSGDAGSYFENSVYSYLLLGFSCQLDVDQEMLDKMASKELDNILQNLPDLCQICLKCLQHSMVVKKSCCFTLCSEI